MSLQVHDAAWVDRYRDMLDHASSARELFYPGDPYNPAPLDDVDPVYDPRRGLITKDTPVASMGSCFAAEIKNWITSHGYRYVERGGGKAMTGQSGPWGNLYTTQSIRQLFEFAFAGWRPVEKFWRHKGRLMDPYRSATEWANEAEMEAERGVLAESIRAIIAEARVLICTMGLCEAMRSTADGAAFFRFPPEDVFDPARHEPHWYGAAENLANLERSYALIREANPVLQLIVTLSPVPMRATLRRERAVVADEISKSTLRVVLDEFCRRHPEVVYMPSYEVVKRLCPPASGGAWEHDNRHVLPHAVARIMRLFMSNYGDLAPGARAEPDRFAPPPSTVLECTFRMRYATEVVRRAIAEHPVGRIGVFGAGRHTEALVSAIAEAGFETSRLVILDDRPRRTNVGGIPVVATAQADASGFAAVVTSSDSIEPVLFARAFDWCGHLPAHRRPSVIRLYEGLPAGPYRAADTIDPRRPAQPSASVKPAPLRKAG